MEREIIFRGKELGIGDWAYGDLTNLEIDGKEYAKIGRFYVDPSTVGQHTGLTDRNGKKIFDGDIVRGMAYSEEWIGEIIWINKIASFGARFGHDVAWENSSILKRAARGMHDEFTAEVIGNRWDNPELLEVKK